MDLYRYKEKITIRGLFLDKVKKNRKTNVFRYPVKFYKGYETLIFKNQLFNVPSPSKKYLVYVYGKDWEIPIKNEKKLRKLKRYQKQKGVRIK